MTQQKKKSPKQAWGAAVNLSGLYSQNPIPLRWHVDLRAWWSADGNFEFEALEVEIHKPGFRRFASADKAKVQAWLNGAKAVMGLLRHWAMVDDSE